MSRFLPARVCLTTLLALIVANGGTPSIRAGETALDRYIAKPDKTYSWKLVRKTQVPGATVFVVDLKSQTWRTSKEVNQPVWQHWLMIVKPDKPAGTIPFLFITGGKNSDAAPPKVDPAIIAMTAKASHGIVCELKMVPNQPLIFKNDGRKRSEDDLIAYTYAAFLAGGDDEWPARLPMTKSAVRAMDCIQELLASDEGGKLKVEKFVVAGGSKRGWTTWCTAAVDKRVAAIVPSSIDCLNNELSMAHHVAVYGFYTLAVGNYVRGNVVQQTANLRMKLLNAIEDPDSYRELFTMPKYVVNASGDQYFCPDSSQFYFDALPGEKYLRYVPNAAHNLKGSEARDFRLMSIGKAFRPTTLTDQGDGNYVAKLAKPERGWTASFVELAFDVGAPNAFKVSTAVRVTPDTLPHADLDPAKAPPEKPRARLRASSN